MLKVHFFKILKYHCVVTWWLKLEKNVIVDLTFFIATILVVIQHRYQPMRDLLIIQPGLVFKEISDIVHFLFTLL